MKERDGNEINRKGGIERKTEKGGRERMREKRVLEMKHGKDGERERGTGRHGIEGCCVLLLKVGGGKTKSLVFFSLSPSVPQTNTHTHTHTHPHTHTHTHTHTPPL